MDLDFKKKMIMATSITVGIVLLITIASLLLIYYIIPVDPNQFPRESLDDKDVFLGGVDLCEKPIVYYLFSRDDNNTFELFNDNAPRIGYTIQLDGNPLVVLCETVTTDPEDDTGDSNNIILYLYTSGLSSATRGFFFSTTKYDPVPLTTAPFVGWTRKPYRAYKPIFSFASGGIPLEPITIGNCSFQLEANIPMKYFYGIPIQTSIQIINEREFVNDNLILGYMRATTYYVATLASDKTYNKRERVTETRFFSYSGFQ